MMSTPSACSARASWFSISAKANASFTVAVVAVGHRVDDRHRARQRELDLARGVRAQETRFGLMHAALSLAAPPPAAPSPCSGRRGCPSRPCARSRCLRPARESRARNAGAIARRRRCREAGILLRLDPQQRGVELGRFSASPSCAHGPQLVRFGQPRRLGQAARDRGSEHRCRLRLNQCFTRCRGKRAGAAAPLAAPRPARAAAMAASRQDRSRRRARGGWPH